MPGFLPHWGKGRPLRQPPSPYRDLCPAPLKKFLEESQHATETSGGGGVTCICRDTGMCHYFGYFLGGCFRIFGYLYGLFPDFWVSCFGYSRIFVYYFLVKFDFFKNNPDFGVLILIFASMTLWNCCLQGSCFYDSTVLVSVLSCLCKEFHIVFTCYQFEFLYM